MFRLNDLLTEEQAATILTRLMHIVGNVPNAHANLFSDDIDISDWAKESVYVMRHTGIMLGVNGNHFASQLFHQQRITLCR